MGVVVAEGSATRPQTTPGLALAPSRDVVSPHACELRCVLPFELSFRLNWPQPVSVRSSLVILAESLAVSHFDDYWDFSVPSP